LKRDETTPAGVGSGTLAADWSTNTTMPICANHLGPQSARSQNPIIQKYILLPKIDTRIGDIKITLCG
jgi:hypothetical protein